jgi:hypothetical protein
MRHCSNVPPWNAWPVGDSRSNSKTNLNELPPSCPRISTSLRKATPQHLSDLQLSCHATPPGTVPLPANRFVFRTLLPASGTSHFDISVVLFVWMFRAISGGPHSQPPQLTSRGFFAIPGCAYQRRALNLCQPTCPYASFLRKILTDAPHVFTQIAHVAALWTKDPHTTGWFGDYMSHFAFALCASWSTHGRCVKTSFRIAIAFSAC